MTKVLSLILIILVLGLGAVFFYFNVGNNNSIRSYKILDVDFSFYEEGGFSGHIRGERVLLGTASFMRKMDVRLPGGLNLKTGVYLAVDSHLWAVFAVKYHASENVDWALWIMKRNRITPILASRDPNVTPALLSRKFHKNVRVEYPNLSDRVALSEV